MLMEKVNRYRGIIETAMQGVDDETALQAVSIFPDYGELIERTKGGNMGAVEKGFRFSYNGELWRTEQPKHTFDGVYAPGVGTESLYSKVALPSEGGEDAPIEYTGNMEIFEGKYYTQDGVLYRCTRSSGQPLQHPLSALVGLYVEVV